MGSKAVTTRQNRYIGITMFTLSPEFLSDLQARVPNFPQHITSGVLVPTVIHGSPAHRWENITVYMYTLFFLYNLHTNDKEASLFIQDRRLSTK